MSSLIAKYYADRENFGSDGCIPVAVVGISSSESVVVGIGSESVVGGGSVMGAELAVGTSSEGTGYTVTKLCTYIHVYYTHHVL